MPSPALPLKLQDLPPRAAHLCLGVEAFFRELFSSSEHPHLPQSAVLGFSGGADSTALAVMLCCLSERLGLSLHVAHLDHGLRPESAREADQAKALCARLGLACVVERRDVAALAREHHLGIEEAGRRARYTFLETVRQETGADLCLTAHHLNDLAEDVLMRLVRGTGWPALGGMHALDLERCLLRPLLLTPREDIEQFLRDIGLDWTEDPSNLDMQFLRNRVRHTLLPLFVQENPNFLASISGLWRLAQLDSEYFLSLQPDISALLEVSQNSTTSLDSFQSENCPVRDSLDRHVIHENHTLFLGQDSLDLPPALRLRLYKLALEKLGLGQPLLETLFKLDRAWSERQTGKVFQFPGPKTAEIERHGIRFVQTRTK
ncbi:MAG: tRNA lysidine(34) synthetase TilS [Desulfovibrio sp.]|mgnify:CR=1 FL=1|nr:MAG: tRNA lysidine(34) synthetase TilS [Desulfovibrio sp.]